MNLDEFVTAIILIAAFYLLFFIGKLVHDLLHREYNLTEELVEKDNPAIALAITGYYMGLVLCLGGAVAGPSHGIVEDLIDICLYGLLGVVLLNISWFLCDKVILRKFRVNDELIRDRNQGTGAVSFGVCVASGFVIFGSVTGEGGNVLTALAFWGIGQAVLIIATFLYNFITPYDLHAEIEKDNVAAGVGFAGALISMGMIVGLSAARDFHYWEDDVPEFLIITVIGLLFLPAIRFLTDKVLLPTVKLTDEIANQETPNVGAAYIEAFSYIAGALIIYWCV